MSTFRFRAAVVLELRTRQEQAAAAVLSRAKTALAESQARLASDTQARQAAQSDASAHELRGATSAEIEWHRNWIVRLTSNVDQRRADMDLRRRAVIDAERGWRAARQRRLAIERMRDRAWSRFQERQRREELNVIDELAGLRYVPPDVWGESS